VGSLKLRNQEDFYAGLMFVAFGAFFAAVGTQYPRGTADNMGAGYVPVALGIIVVALGTIVSASSFARGAAERRVERIDWWLLLMIPGPVILFGVLLQPLGLVLSLCIVIGIASYASHEFSWKATLVNMVALVALCMGVFVWGLRLPFPIWPKFFGG
jgi:hypothetical protein